MNNVDRKYAEPKLRKLAKEYGIPEDVIDWKSFDYGLSYDELEFEVIKHVETLGYESETKAPITRQELIEHYSNAKEEYGKHLNEVKPTPPIDDGPHPGETYIPTDLFISTCGDPKEFFTQGIHNKTRFNRWKMCVITRGFDEWYYLTEFTDEQRAAKEERHRKEKEADNLLVDSLLEKANEAEAEPPDYYALGDAEIRKTHGNYRIEKEVKVKLIPKMDAKFDKLYSSKEKKYDENSARMLYVMGDVIFSPKPISITEDTDNKTRKRIEEHNSKLELDDIRLATPKNMADDRKKIFETNRETNRRLEEKEIEDWRTYMKEREKEKTQKSAKKSV